MRPLVRKGSDVVGFYRDVQKDIEGDPTKYEYYALMEEVERIMGPSFHAPTWQVQIEDDVIRDPGGATYFDAEWAEQYLADLEAGQASAPKLAPAADDDEGRGLSSAEASNRTKLSSTTLGTLATQGKIKREMINGKWEYNSASLAAYMATEEYTARTQWGKSGTALDALGEYFDSGDLADLRRSGDINALKIGNTWYYDPGSLSEYTESDAYSDIIGTYENFTLVKDIAPDLQPYADISNDWVEDRVREGKIAGKYVEGHGWFVENTVGVQDILDVHIEASKPGAKAAKDGTLTLPQARTRLQDLILDIDAISTSEFNDLLAEGIGGLTSEIGDEGRFVSSSIFIGLDLDAVTSFINTDRADREAAAVAAKIAEDEAAEAAEPKTLTKELALMKKFELDALVMSHDEATGSVPQSWWNEEVGDYVLPEGEKWPDFTKAEETEEPATHYGITTAERLIEQEIDDIMTGPERDRLVAGKVIPTELIDGTLQVPISFFEDMNITPITSALAGYREEPAVEEKLKEPSFTQMEGYIEDALVIAGLTTDELSAEELNSIVGAKLWPTTDEGGFVPIEEVSLDLPAILKQRDAFRESKKKPEEPEEIRPFESLDEWSIALGENITKGEAIKLIGQGYEGYSDPDTGALKGFVPGELKRYQADIASAAEAESARVTKEYKDKPLSDFLVPGDEYLSESEITTNILGKMPGLETMKDWEETFGGSLEDSGIWQVSSVGPIWAEKGGISTADQMDAVGGADASVGADALSIDTDQLFTDAQVGDGKSATTSVSDVVDDGAVSDAQMILERNVGNIPGEPGSSLDALKVLQDLSADAPPTSSITADLAIDTDDVPELNINLIASDEPQGTLDPIIVDAQVYPTDHIATRDSLIDPVQNTGAVVDDSIYTPDQQAYMEAKPSGEREQAQKATNASAKIMGDRELGDGRSATVEMETSVTGQPEIGVPAQTQRERVQSSPEYAAQQVAKVAEADRAYQQWKITGKDPRYVANVKRYEEERLRNG
jgi:hypothetical protein